jgi:hypothetical protein
VRTHGEKRGDFLSREIHGQMVECRWGKEDDPTVQLTTGSHGSVSKGMHA